jgi:hypothetical protein
MNKMQKEPTKKVYTISYTMNKKDKAINVLADSEENARVYFKNVLIPKFYEQFLIKYDIELPQRFEKRFELLSVNKNTAYSKK